VPERVLIVDESNRPVGVVPRSEMRARRLPHRATYIFVFRSTGELTVQLRTLTKDVYPGFLDLAAGGVVVDGESYEESARRELAEELGIQDVPLEMRFDFWFEPGRVWGRVFTCAWDGPLVLQPEEVAAVEFLPPDEALSGRHAGPFTPDSLVALRRLVEATN
jgi:8-oxo-dGTP pyrophosphatase MutT (NUDIX family)